MRVMKNFAKGLLRIIRNFIILILILVLLMMGFVFAAVFKGTTGYPVKYSEEIVANAQQYGIDEYLLAGIIKTESDYDASAVSSVDAVGLMQLLPDTAQWCAKQLGLEYSREKLLEPEYNIQLGAYYISYLIAHFQNIDLALAAYNTGLNNVDAWLEDGTITWEKASLQSIPYEEPREYVKKVNRAAQIYGVFYREGLSPDIEQQTTWKLTIGNFFDLFRWAKQML